MAVLAYNKGAFGQSSAHWLIDTGAFEENESIGEFHADFI